MNSTKNRKHPAVWVFLMVIAGLVIVAGGIWIFTWGCNSGTATDGWCGILKEHPPWTVISGLATIPAIILTWIWREQHKRASEKHADAQIAVAQDGQVTERFTRAVEQLGSDKLPARLGAIYALERIAKDSARDHWIIVETLAAFVRTNTEFNGDGTRLERADRVPEDIQAAVTVIGRRNVAHDGEGNTINLSDIDLSDTDFKKCHLEKAFLAMTDFSQANFVGASLVGAHLEYTSLTSANLKNAVLTGAFLEGVDFRNAHLEGADLRRTTGLSADLLSKANLDHDTLLPPGFESLVPPKPEEG